MSPEEIEAAFTCSPMSPPVFEVRPKPWFEISMEFTDVNPEVIDLLFYGQSPGLHITLGEE